MVGNPLVKRFKGLLLKVPNQPEVASTLEPTDTGPEK
jgi:hypothetical protein